MTDGDIAIEIEDQSEASEPPLSVSELGETPGRDRIAEITLHSEPVVQILGIPPRWLARWGACVMACIVVALAALAWFVHYPDVVTASVVITTPVPPAIVVARASGHLEALAVRDGDTVQRGTLLARIDSSADANAVADLEAALSRWQSDRDLSATAIAAFTNMPLGELEGDYAVVARAYETYHWRLSADPVGVQIRALTAQRSPLADRIEALQREQALFEQEVTVAERGYARSEELVRHQNASLLTLDDRERQVIDAKRGVQTNLMDLANTKLDIARIDQTLVELAMRDRQEKQDLLVAWHEALKTLAGKLVAWERIYILRAPISGKVSLSQFWTDSQFIHAGDDVMAIVPEESRDPIGRASLPISRAGSVRIGQTVFVRLDNYPSEQFGLLKGRIVAIAPVPFVGRYAVDISLSAGLTTTYGQPLTYQQEMQGLAEIVVEDLRVIDRIFYQFERRLRSETIVAPPLARATPSVDNVSKP